MAVGDLAAPEVPNAAGTVRATSPLGGPCAAAAIGEGLADERAHATRTPNTAATTTRRTSTPSTARRRGLARTPRSATGTVRIAGLGGPGRRWRPLSGRPGANPAGAQSAAVQNASADSAAGATTAAGTTAGRTVSAGAPADAGTTAGVKAIASPGTNDARCGIQPASGKDRAPEGASPRDTAPDTAGLDTAADDRPRMAAQRSTGGGWGRRRGIPARYERGEGRRRHTGRTVERRATRHTAVDSPG